MSTITTPRTDVDQVLIAPDGSTKYQPTRPAPVPLDPGPVASTTATATPEEMAEWCHPRRTTRITGSRVPASAGHDEF